jgi:hypothetical protein
MALVDPIVLLRRLGELHRPALKPYPDAEAEDMYLVQCRACDGSAWRIWRKGDPAEQCEYWRDYSARGHTG